MIKKIYCKHFRNQSNIFINLQKFKKTKYFVKLRYFTCNTKTHSHKLIHAQKTYGNLMTFIVTSIKITFSENTLRRTPGIIQSYYYKQFFV